MENLLRPSVPISLPADFPGFKGLFSFQSREFCGAAGKCHHFCLHKETQTQSLFCAWMILKEDALAWTSFRELWDQALKLAASQMRGFFGLELFFLDLKEGLSGFHPGNLTELIVNHSKKLEVGAQVLIRYASLWMVLSKRTNEDWGKIDFKSRVDVVTKPGPLDLTLKKMAQEASDLAKESQPPIFLIMDLGEIPVFKFGSEEQTERIHKWFTDLQKKNENIPEIYFYHQGKLTDLAAQFGFRDV